jgi:hypothetical protein
MNSNSIQNNNNNNNHNNSNNNESFIRSILETFKCFVCGSKPEEEADLSLKTLN